MILDGPTLDALGYGEPWLALAAHGIADARGKHSKHVSGAAHPRSRAGKAAREEAARQEKKRAKWRRAWARRAARKAAA